MKGSFSTQYGSGAVKGKLFMATLSMGSQINATLPIGVSDQEDGFNDGYTDGLMGLAFDSISQISKSSKQNSNFMDQLSGVKSKKLKNMVSFYMSSTEKNRGQVTFGSSDQSKYTGSINYIPLNSKSYWQFDFSDSFFSVGSNKVPSDSKKKPKNAIADTGTSLILLDDTTATSLNKAIGAVKSKQDKDLYSFKDCSAAKKGSPVTLTIQGKAYTIPASIYVLEGLEKGICTSGFSGGIKQSDQVILGLTFLRAYYSIYDKVNARVGFAKSIDNKS